MNKFIEKHLQSSGVKKYSNTYKQDKLFPLVIISFILLFSSCVTQRDLEYLRDKSKQRGDVTAFDDAKVPEYKLKPKDELYIKINSLDGPETNVFMQLGSGGNSSSSTSTSPYSLSYESYQVDSVGFVRFPILGNIQVENKTLQEVRAIIQDSVKYILSKPEVRVRLVNRYVSVLGYVEQPGHFNYNQEKFTVFDALSLAGDITIYGDRDDVIIARNVNGKNLRINIDLTSTDLMASEYYYIQPNDKIYVKPMRKRFWGFETFPYNAILATATTLLVIYTIWGQ